MKLLTVAAALTLIQITQQQSLLPATKTYPEFFPYHAYVVADLYCLGALISTRYVLVNAVCIESRTRARVYLGTRSDPYYQIFPSKGSQIIKSAEVVPHPQYGKKITHDLLVNNIGLVKLRDPAIITTNVQPVPLASKQDFPIPPGTFLNVTGYLDSVFHTDMLRYMTVRLRPQYQCAEFYGHGILKDDELCVQGLGDRLDWPGAFTMDGKLVGIARVLSRSVTCKVYTPPCSRKDVFLSIEKYLDWIYDNSDVPRPEPPRIEIISQPLPTIVLQPPRAPEVEVFDIIPLKRTQS